MVSQNSINNTVADNDFSVNRATAGTAVVSSAEHSDNTNTGSNAVLQAQVGGTSGGDPFVYLNVSGGNAWSIGMDNTSTTDLLKVTNGASPSAGTSFMTVGNNGTVDFVGFFDYTTGPGAITGMPVVALDEKIAGRVGFSAANSDNTDTNSDAGFAAQVGGTSAGDPFLNWQIVGSTTYSMGIDNSDSDKLKIQDGGDPSLGNTVWEMTTAGERTMPLQPAFLAYNSASDTNQTGAGAVVTVEFDTEVFDQNADYNNATDTFTAPVTGRYRLSTTVRTSSITAAMTQIDLRIVTSNRSYASKIINPGAVKDSNDQFAATATVLADMDAADTAYITVALYNGAGNTASIIGSASPLSTYFSGSLIC